MSFARTVFVAVDKMYDAPQNKRKETRYKDAGIIVEKDIVYDESSPDVCLLDTYRVGGKDGKYPALFYIHGGGFVAGDKRHRRALCRWSAVKGFFVVNINYGLCPESLFPEPLRHITRALNWVESNAEKYNLDLDRMLVSGDSAGGYYAAMLACICLNQKLRDRLGVSVSSRFEGAILNCGIYDVGQALKAKVLLNLTDKVLWDFARIKKEDFDKFEWKDICAPIDFVTPEFPATFLTYAEQDFFCGGQGPKMIDKLRECGVHVEEFHSTKFGENHCFSLNWKGPAAEENNRLTADFMERFLKGEI